LGVEGFAEGLRHLVTEKQQIREIQGSKIRSASEFGEAIFAESPGKASNARLIAEVITVHGYSQMKMASFLGLHYSTISRIRDDRWSEAIAVGSAGFVEQVKNE
jgi:hypothetical protein